MSTNANDLASQVSDLSLETNPNHNSNSGGSDDSDSTPPATPIFQPSHLHPEPTVLLTLTSFQHLPPLQPSPDLKYDLRNFPSPEKNVRSKYDGRTKRLRDWLTREPEYAELLGKVEAEILAKGKELEIEAEKEKEEKEKAEADKAMAAATPAEPSAPAEVPLPESAPQSAVEETKDEETKDEERSTTPTADRTEVEADVEEEDEEEVTPLNAPKNLRVGVSCEMGRHRSVAFIEELSRRKWPVEWAVEIVHRDVGKQRNPRKGTTRSGAHEKGGRLRKVKGDHFSTEVEV